MITNEYDFLGLLISAADENHNCDVRSVMNKAGVSDVDALAFIESLDEKGLAKMQDFSSIHIYPNAYEIYKTNSQKMGKSVKSASKFTLTKIIEIIVAVIGGLVIAYCTYRFNWN